MTPKKSLNGQIQESSLLLKHKPRGFSKTSVTKFTRTRILKALEESAGQSPRAQALVPASLEEEEGQVVGTATQWGIT